MKRLLLAPLLLVLTSCSNNVTIKNDVGEAFKIKDSTVKIVKEYKFNDLIIIFESLKKEELEEFISKNLKKNYELLISNVEKKFNSEIVDMEKPLKDLRTQYDIHLRNSFYFMSKYRIYKSGNAPYWTNDKARVKYNYANDKKEEIKEKIDIIYEKVKNLENEKEKQIALIVKQRDKDRKDIYDLYFLNLKKSIPINNFIKEVSLKPIFIDLNKKKTVLTKLRTKCFNPKLDKKYISVIKTFYADKDLSLESEIHNKISNRYAKF